MIKNTTHNYSANELINLIIEVKKAQKAYDAAYPFSAGVLIALIDSSRNGYCNLQEEINRNYAIYSKELAQAQAA